MIPRPLFDIPPVPASHPSGCIDEVISVFARECGVCPPYVYDYFGLCNARFLALLRLLYNI